MISNFDPNQYHIIDVIDLLDYDTKPEALLNKLLDLKKSVFNHDEKIIVLHNDTEYFYLGNDIGFTTYNLLRAWQHADIPWHVLVLYANQCGLEKRIDKYWQFVSVDKPIIVENLVNNYNVFYSKEFLQKPVDKNITHKAICLMGGTLRGQRVALYKWIKSNELLEDVCTSFSSNSSIPSIQQKNPRKNADNKYMQVDTVSDIDFVKSNTSRINEGFLLKNIPEFEHWIDTKTEYHKHPFLNNDLHTVYQNTFADIVCETVFQYPGAFFSEKTLRPILAETPFVLFGAPESLACLRSYGFETFANLWDESYDLEQNHHLRFLKCCSIIKEIATMSTLECANLYEQIRPTVEHNRKVLLNYIDNTYQTLYSVVENRII